MKKKAGFLFFVILFVAACLFPGGNAGAYQEQTIRSEASAAARLHLWEKDITTSDAGQSDNQGIGIRNPTFKELKDFIIKDPTSRNVFVYNKYECRHFATDVNNNAEAVGIRCAFVLLCFHYGQHAVVAFDTTDRGLVYIEPQTDVVIHPEVGGTYQGQQIIEILVSW